MNQCPTCKYFFNNYTIQGHYKLCTILNALTGRKNNLNLIGQLTPFQKRQIILYYQNILNQKQQKQQKQLTYPSKPNSKQSTYNYNNKNKQLTVVNTTANNNEKQYSYTDSYMAQRLRSYNARRIIPPYNPKPSPTINTIPTYPPQRQLTYWQPSKTPPENNTLKNALTHTNVSQLVRTTPIIQYEDYIKYKRIALVGPSKSLIGQHKGKELDAYDLIVRLNKALPIPDNLKQELGTRTDILYNSLNTSDHPGENNIDPKFFLKNKVKYLCCSYPNIYPFQKDIGVFLEMNRHTQMPFRTLPLDLYDKMERALGCRPYTGICAIMDLLRFNIKELYITGMDFYATGYYKEYSNKSVDLKRLRNNNIHQALPQIVLLRKIVLNDFRVKVDKILHKILFSFYRYVFKYTTQKFAFNQCLLTLANGPPTESYLYGVYMAIKQQPKTIYLVGNNIRQEDINWIYYNTRMNDIIFSMNDKLAQCSVWIDCNPQTTKETVMQYKTVINIFRKKEQKYRVDDNNILKFNNKYNMEVNQRLKQTDIENCSISLYLILMTCMYFNTDVKIIGFDFSQRKEESLFIKYLLRENYIQEVNTYLS